jgi:hypothetical protein
VRPRWQSRRRCVRVGAHQQPRVRTVPLEARVTATWNVRSLGVFGGPKGAPGSRMFHDPQTALGLIGLVAARSP